MGGSGNGKGAGRWVGVGVAGDVQNWQGRTRALRPRCGGNFLSSSIALDDRSVRFLIQNEVCLGCNSAGFNISDLSQCPCVCVFIEDPDMQQDLEARTSEQTDNMNSRLFLKLIYLLDLRYGY